MRAKFEALYVIGECDHWMALRKKIVNDIYEKQIDKSMERSFSNLYMGRTREKAIRYLDNWKTGVILNFNSYLDKLEWSTSYRASIVENVKMLCEKSISFGDGFVWLNEEECNFIRSK